MFNYRAYSFHPPQDAINSLWVSPQNITLNILQHLLTCDAITNNMYNSILFYVSFNVLVIISALAITPDQANDCQFWDHQRIPSRTGQLSCNKPQLRSAQSSIPSVSSQSTCPSPLTVASLQLRTVHPGLSLDATPTHGKVQWSHHYYCPRAVCCCDENK